MADLEQNPVAAAEPYDDGTNSAEGNEQAEKAGQADPVEQVEQADPVGERGNWQPKDADGFHSALSGHTRFEVGVLQLDHRYLDFRDIEMLESLESLPREERLSDDDIIQRLETLNESNPNRDCRRLYLLLRELQAAAGNKHTVRQINTKHINTRSRWSVPFKSLNEVGFLIKNQAVRGAKKKADDDPNSPRRRTNVERKNLAATKALRKFTKFKDLYWCVATQSMPDAQAQAAFVAAHPDMDDMSEPERWMRAMIRRHGQAMVNYLDTCSFKLAETYYNEIAARQGATQPVPLAATDTERIVRLLNNMVDEVSAMANDSKQKKGPRRKPSTPTPRKRATKATVAAAAAAAASAAAASAGLPAVSADDSFLAAAAAGDGIDYKRPTSSRPIPGLVSDREYLDESGQPLMIKKSRSHIFGAGAGDTPGSMSAHHSYLDMAAYDGVNSIATTLLRGDSSAPVSGRLMPYDDGLFTQFINYESAVRAQQNDYSAPAVSGPDAEGTVPADLTEGIFNLTVEAGPTPAPHAVDPQHHQHQYHQYHHHHTRSDALDYGAGMSNPHQYFGTGLHQDPAPSTMSRSTSDDRHIPGVYVGSQETVGDYQGLFGGGRQSAFTFQMAPPYAWAQEGAPEDSALLTQSMSYPSLAAYEAGLAMAHHTVDYSGLHAGRAGSPLTSSSGASQAAPLPDRSEPAAEAKLSTRLIYVNGVPSHIELVHNTNGVAHDPIILPISEVKDNN